ncbi:MAG: hypothetical protein KC652_23305 [Cyanobacteria bacterium HKST-UBA01]|nr:hypothetical protein [Cyanobacteria bacterium HKST-UBA01]
MLTVEIRTGLFPTEPEGDLETCNGQPGSAFAIWLKEKLSGSGIECDEVLQEDYGWGLWLKSNDEPIWVCVSHAPEDDDEDEGAKTWFVSANYERPFSFLMPWLWGKKKNGLEEEKRIFDLIVTCLREDSQIDIVNTN